LKLSVIIPCLNGGDTLAFQLEALAAQQWSEPWELIIADGGSTDKTLEIANKYKNYFSGFRIIDASARRGPAFARNVGVKAALSGRLAFCDADDEVASGWIAAMGEALNRYDVVYGKFRFDKFNEPRQAEDMAQFWKAGLIKKNFLPGGGTGNLGINRRVHEAIGGFDERLPWNEDADYYWRLQLEGFELHYIPEAVVEVRVGRVNPSLPYLYRRSRNRATANYWSYKKYCHLGMQSPPLLRESLASWLSILRGLPALLKNEHIRTIWLQQVARQTGDLVGQFQGRINNPCKPYHPGKKGQLRSG